MMMTLLLVHPNMMFLLSGGRCQLTLKALEELQQRHSFLA
jgi:hypothetical protein